MLEVRVPSRAKPIYVTKLLPLEEIRNGKVETLGKLRYVESEVGYFVEKRGSLELRLRGKELYEVIVPLSYWAPQLYYLAYVDKDASYAKKYYLFDRRPIEESNGYYRTRVRFVELPSEASERLEKFRMEHGISITRDPEGFRRYVLLTRKHRISDIVGRIIDRSFECLLSGSNDDVRECLANTFVALSEL